MDRKKLVLLLGALVVAIGSAFLARSMFAGDAAPTAEAQEETGPKVLVANRALPVGTIITADAMGFQKWPEELVKDAYFIEGNADMSELLGTVVRYAITAGEPVTKGALVSPGDRGFLAAALTPGMRAVTVPVSATTGVGGFVFPGDRVDLVLVQTFERDNTELDGGETILQNLRVLATDQSTETVTDEEGKTVVKAFRTVTLEVTPEYAEMVSIAQSMGSLTLALRSLSDSKEGIERAIASGDVRIPANATPEEEERILRAASSRPVRGSKKFQTASDVSSFYKALSTATTAQTKAVATPPSMGVPATTANNTPVNTGPTVRVTRGKATTEVPVGGSLSGNVAPGAGQVGPTGGPSGGTNVLETRR